MCSTPDGSRILTASVNTSGGENEDFGKALGQLLDTVFCDRPPAR